MKQNEIIEVIIDQINSMNEQELLNLNNAYCDSCNCMDNYIHNNDEEFFDMLGWSGLRVAQATFYGDYNYSHAYLTFDGYGNFQSYDHLTTDNLADLVETIAEYIAENTEDFQFLFNINLESFKD